MYELEGTEFVAMTESEYLEHFGVPGMKWGVRRAQKKAAHAANKKAFKAAKKEWKDANVAYANSDKKHLKSTDKRARKADGDFYNAKRKLKGKKTYSNEEGYQRQHRKDIAKVFGAVAATSVMMYAASHPDQTAKGEQFLAKNSARGVRSSAKFAANTNVAKVYARHKKYGNYINTTLAGIGQ